MTVAFEVPASLRPKSKEDARRLQDEISGLVALGPLEKEIETVGGVDAIFDGDSVIACVSVFGYKPLVAIEDACGTEETSFPYIPGYLSFREGPAMFSAIRRLGRLPDLLIFDGQGIAHPRRAGIASHLGVLLDIPSIGCAKSRLVGEFIQPSLEKGSWEPLYYKGETVGAALVTRRGCRPVFVSPGHRITLEESIAVILDLSPVYRIPEPIRAADALSRRMRKGL